MSSKRKEDLIYRISASRMEKYEEIQKTKQENMQLMEDLRREET